MALEMIPPGTAPAFLEQAGWTGAAILPLAGDASFRRYFRVHLGDRSAVLMDAPPEHEDVAPFLRIADHLHARGFHAPRILARDLDRGLLLLEDFGDDRVGPLLARDPTRERAIYAEAVDILADLAAAPPPDDLPRYDAAILAREAALFPQWYLPAVGAQAGASVYEAAWAATWGDVLAETARDPVLTLRDYHADNLMVLPGGGLGLLDFQDALAGHRAYDLVSLLQDARRDVPRALEEEMLARYVRAAGHRDPAAFRAHYELLGAQRNTKILGIFTRLWRRDNKRHYLAFQPRVWAYLERNLAHPALAPVKAWFDAYVPAEKRAAAWAGKDAA